MKTKQTAVDTLFDVFKVMSNSMREAGDEQYANILDYLCNEFLNKAKAMEKEQIIEFANKVLYNAECSFTGTAYLEKDINEIYNETYGN